MTFGDLKRQIFNLNWEDEKSYADSKTIISDSITRALKTIAIEVRPIIKQYKISQCPLANFVKPFVSRDAQFHYNGTDKLLFFGDQVKAYSFFCDGIGTATITDNTGIKEIEILSGGSYKLYRGFLKGNATIEFSGDYSYNVKSIAMYKEIVSNKETDIIPYSSQVRYDFFELLKDEKGISQFMGFSDKAVEGSFSDGKTIKSLNDFIVEKNSVLVLDGTFKGEFLISYKKKPQEFAEKTANETVIEIDEDAVDLLPLLASYYVWLDDERSRAQEYYNQYEIRRDNILGKSRQVTATVVLGGYTPWL